MVCESIFATVQRSSDDENRTADGSWSDEEWDECYVSGIVVLLVERLLTVAQCGEL